MGFEVMSANEVQIILNFNLTNLQIQRDSISSKEIRNSFSNTDTFLAL